MIKSFFLTILISFGSIFLLVKCDSALEDFDEQELGEERDPRFAQCYHEEDLAKNKCDSVLRSFFGSTGFKNLSLNSDLSFVGCDEGETMEMLSFGDKNCCLPRTYDLVYDVIFKGDTVCQIPMVAGSEMKFEFISEEEKVKLLPYKALLRGDIAFDYADLLSEMKRRNMNPDDYEIELIDDLETNLENSIYWELYYADENDEMMFFRVNTRNGVFTQARPVTRMGD